MDEKEIEKVFGEEENQTTQIQGSSSQPNNPSNVPTQKKKGFGTSAYMLMYRRRSPSNKNTFTMDEIPPSIYQLIQKDNEDFEKAKAKFQMRKESLQLRIQFKDQTEMILVHKTETLQTATVTKNINPNHFFMPLLFRDLHLKPFFLVFLLNLKMYDFENIIYLKNCLD